MIALHGGQSTSDPVVCSGVFRPSSYPRITFPTQHQALSSTRQLSGIFFGSLKGWGVTRVVGWRGGDHLTVMPYVNYNCNEIIYFLSLSLSR